MFCYSADYIHSWWFKPNFTVFADSDHIMKSNCLPHSPLWGLEVDAEADVDGPHSSLSSCSGSNLTSSMNLPPPSSGESSPDTCSASAWRKTRSSRWSRSWSAWSGSVLMVSLRLVCPAEICSSVTFLRNQKQQMLHNSPPHKFRCNEMMNICLWSFLSP